MNALHQPVPAPRPPQTGRAPGRVRRLRSQPIRRNRAAYRGQALETMALLGINTLLIGIGLYTLTQLLPHQFSQHAKLQLLQEEAAAADQRLQQLRVDYQQNLTPTQSQKIAEEQGYLMGKKKLTVNWQK